MDTAEAIIRQNALPPEQLAAARASINLGPYLAFKRKRECADRALAKPLPGEAAGAVLNGPIKVGTRNVRRIVPTYFKILTALDSPLLKMMEQATDKKESSMDWTPEQEWEICWMFTNDIKKVKQVFESGGVDAIRKVVSDEVGDDENWASEIRIVTLAVMEQIRRHVQTKVKIIADLEEGGQMTHFFRELNPPETKPASAGS